MKIIVTLTALLLCNILDIKATNYLNNNPFFYLEVDELPKFPSEKYGGLYDYIYSNIKYPQEASISGKVIVSFIVSKDGNIQKVKIEKPLCEECDNEVRRLLTSMPQWLAGRKAGRKVDTLLIIPISFNLH